MSRRRTGISASPLCESMQATVKQLGMALALIVSVVPCSASAANKDLVIIESERWIDTIKGTVKNVSADRAEEVVIVVRFYGDAVSTTRPQSRKSARRQEMGQQTVKMATLEPGQEAPFEVEIVEKHRKATSFKFEPHAIWLKGSKTGSHGH